jgi:putative restriction endonuclease
LPDEEVLRALARKSYKEGRRFLSHRRLEGIRNKKLVSDAKRLFKDTHGGKLTCEVCDMNFEMEYGRRGSEFIEAHHKARFKEVEGETSLGISDLAIVCANCHRMLHRDPWVSVGSLRMEWKKLHKAK